MSHSYISKLEIDTAQLEYATVLPLLSKKLLNLKELVFMNRIFTHQGQMNKSKYTHTTMPKTSFTSIHWNGTRYDSYALKVSTVDDKRTIYFTGDTKQKMYLYQP